MAAEERAKYQGVGLKDNIKALRHHFEELDVVINYDIKYRMGRDNEGE